MTRPWTLVVLVLALAGCGSEPTSAPNLIGLALPDARESAEAAGVELDEIDASGDGRAVFAPGNWTVERQEPAGGTPLDDDRLTLWISNVRDQEPEPVEVADEAEPTPEPTPEPEPEPGPQDRSLEADVAEGPTGLRIIPEEDVYDCLVDVNPGLIRSGYMARVAEMAAGDPTVVPWSELTARDGERFDYSRYRPEMVSIRCKDADGANVYDTWGW